MTYTRATVQQFLEGVFPFSQLSSEKLAILAAAGELLRYRLGQPLAVYDQMPAQVPIVYEGQVRLLGYEPPHQQPITLQLLQPGDSLGWVSLLRGIPCETAIASTEITCFILSADAFFALLKREPAIATAFHQKPSLSEVFDVLSADLKQRANHEAVLQANAVNDLKELALKSYADVVVHTLRPGKATLNELDRDRVWYVSSGSITNHPSNRPFRLQNGQSYLKVEGTIPARLIGIRDTSLFSLLPEPSVLPFPGRSSSKEAPPVIEAEDVDAKEDIPYAPERLPQGSPVSKPRRSRSKTYPFVSGKDPVNATVACFQMLSQYWDMPFRREVIHRVLKNQATRTQSLSLQLCGAISEMMGLNAQLLSVPTVAITRLQTPALIRWQNSFALLYEVSDKELILGIPSIGVVRQSPNIFAENWGEEGQVLLLKRAKDTPQQKFDLRWFLPSLFRYRKVLIEVLIASFFVQLLGLANPLITQLIIDKVIVQNSYDTLNVLGALLLILAAFEAIISSLRTYLFVDTTNRIDLSLGTVIIDHLLRLPLRFFERRPVGELATRANELENIRQFLTGTALTVVLDAVFSVIYIGVMLVYSWVLTLIALLTIPLFTTLTLGVSPLIRRQLRDKAEQNAETQSFLVEVLSGIQTVKAQNIELRSRWKWQQRYARYVDTGFKTVITSTAAGATSNFLNQISGLLVLWAGAYLVLKGQLTLGQLIAFRIIAGYVTSPLLRLTQLWQNFQETALSLERLGDILNTPPEANEHDRENIPMPEIQGAVKYDNVSFGFNPNEPPQLVNITLDFAPGQFVGIVGQSGSGKSTLTKLLPRLYDLTAGRILIDGYDISKVELYSLRQQIGVVMQDTLLFDGTVQENIALTNPNATTEEIVTAAKVAAAHDFIMTLPHGYNTRVGERGSALSGGQRQRIAIARTVLQNPRLLILDEATSALDYQSERQVCVNLAEAFCDRTVFFITHRLSTVRPADVILLLDRGSVVEQGTHDELMTAKGRYYCLFQQQETQL